jgi:hypothetical protein
MEQYFAPAAQQSSHEITSLGSSGELFLDRYNDLISATQRAVLPFHFHIASSARGLCLDGDPIAVTIAAKVIEQVVRDKAERTTLDATGLKATVSGTVAKALKTDLTFHLKGLSHTLTPMSLSQAAFMQSLLLPGEQLTIGVGPTGTGKTHLAIAAALNQLSEEHVKRVVITRPHVVMDGETTTAAPIQDLEYDTQFEFFEGTDSTRAHARQNIQQHLHYPRRGAEHDGSKNADGPNPNRPGLQHGGDWQCRPCRFEREQAFRVDSSSRPVARIGYREDSSV